MKKKIIHYNYNTVNLVPARYSGFLVDLNYAYSKNCDSSIISGRKKEILETFNNLSKTNHSSTILLGEHGVGKTAILQKIVDMVVRNKCPKQLKRNHFWFLDLETILANTTNVLGNERFKKFLTEMFSYILRFNNIVVVIDDVHLVMTDATMYYYFKRLVLQGKVLGLTTEEDYYDFFAYENKLQSLLETVIVNEPLRKNVYPMIEKVIHYKEKLHGITIRKELVQYIISLTGISETYLCNPGFTVNIIEKAMIVASNKKQSEVTKKDINSVFGFDYEYYNLIPKKSKLETAYHEAGHYLTSILSDKTKNLRPTAISIIPSAYFSGVTLFDYDVEKYAYTDKEYYIDMISIDLGGREAEKILWKSEHNGKENFTSGASYDLCSAIEGARNIVTRLGMDEKVGLDLAYLGISDFENISLLTEDMKKQIDIATKDIINKASEIAHERLTNNKDILDRIAEELIKNELLDEFELDKICEDVIASRNK